MVNGNETLLTADDEEHDEEGQEWDPDDTPYGGRLDARRSLELHFERQALKKVLRDTFDDGPLNIDELGW